MHGIWLSKKKRLSTVCCCALAFGAGAQNPWMPVAPYAGPARDDAAGFFIGGYGYLGTGLQTGWIPAKDFWKYDPAQDTWTQVADYAGTPRQYSAAFAAGQKGYVFGGTDGGGNPQNDLYEYDPVSNGWMQKTSLPSAGQR